MDIPVYRLIDLARLLFFRALLLEAERRHDVSPSTSAHDTLQTARTHRRRAARRGRGVRPTGAPLSAHGFDSRQRAVDLRPMPDLCGQRARRGRLFAFDANGELIEAPTPAGDAPFAKRTARSSRGAVRSAKRPVPSALLDPPFPERGVRSAKRSVPSAAEDLDASMRSVPSSDLPAPSTAEDLDASMRAVPSSERPMPSAAWDVHAAVRDVLAPAEDVPFAKRAARSSRGAVPSPAEDLDASLWAVPSSALPVSSTAEDLPFVQRAARSSRGAVPSAAEDLDASLWAVPSSDLPAPLPAEDLPSAKRAARSSRRAVHAAPFDPLFLERPMPSAAEDVHAAVRDRGDSSEARYAALAKRSAQTADRLLRRVSRHRAKGK